MNRRRFESSISMEGKVKSILEPSYKEGDRPLGHQLFNDSKRRDVEQLSAKVIESVFPKVITYLEKEILLRYIRGLSPNQIYHDLPSGANATWQTIRKYTQTGLEKLRKAGLINE